MRTIRPIGWSAALLLLAGWAAAQLPQQQSVVPQQVVYQQQPPVAVPQQGAVVQQQTLPATQQSVAVPQQAVAQPLYQPVPQQVVYRQSAPVVQQAVQQNASLQQAVPVAAQYTLTVAEGDNVPQQTVIPEQQAPVQVSESTTYYVVSPEMSRAERRQLQQRDFAARIDSLIRSRNFFFRARTMQELPAGREQRVYADFYYCAVTPDHVEIHLPIELGAAKYIEVLNFDAAILGEYRASRLQSAWNITFDLGRGDATYHVELIVSTATGEVLLTLLTPQVTMRYTGGLQL